MQEGITITISIQCEIFTFSSNTIQFTNIIEIINKGLIEVIHTLNIFYFQTI